MDAAHPALRGFPTREYAEFQWQDLLDRSVSLAFSDSLPLQPIVQIIPDFYHNRKLTNLIEYAVGEGKLLICGINLEDDLADRPAAAQLRTSLMTYMSSAAFNPHHSLEPGELTELLKPRALVDGTGAVQDSG